jgi:hypothetical protein
VPAPTAKKEKKKKKLKKKQKNKKTIDGRNLIFGHKLHIGTPYRGKRVWTRQIPTSCLPVDFYKFFWKDIGAFVFLVIIFWL